MVVDLAEIIVFPPSFIRTDINKPARGVSYHSISTREYRRAKGDTPNPHHV